MDTDLPPLPLRPIIGVICRDCHSVFRALDGAMAAREELCPDCWFRRMMRDGRIVQ